MGVCNSGQGERINVKRIMQASAGVNTCLPDASGAQSISSGLWTTCTTAIQGAGIFALQTWKAICWLWSEVQEAQAAITELEAQIPTHTGIPTFTVNEAVAGTGATATIHTGSTDLHGGVSISLGSSPTAAGGNMGDLVFGTAFPALIFPALGAGPKVPGGIIANAAVSNNGPISSMNLYAYAPSSNLAQSNLVKLFWSVGFPA